MINLQYLLSVIDFCMWFSKTIYQKPLHRHDKLTYIYDWRHEKKALKVNILHFEFLHKTKRHHSVKTERRHSVTFQSPFSRLNGRYISVTIQWLQGGVVHNPFYIRYLTHVSIYPLILVCGFIEELYGCIF